MFGNSFVGDIPEELDNALCYPRTIAYTSTKELRALVYPVAGELAYQVWDDGKMKKDFLLFHFAVEYYNNL